MKTYESIMTDIQSKIESGYYKANDQLPSLRDLAKTYNSTPVTVKKSLSILEERGYIYVIDRKGFFINVPNRRKYTLIFHELKSLNEYTSIQIEGISEVDQNEFKELFNFELPDDVRCIKLVRSFFNKLLPVGYDSKYLFFKSNIKLSLLDIDYLNKSIELVLDNYNIQKKLSISILSDSSKVIDKFYLNDKDVVFEFIQIYTTISGQPVGASITYIPCEELALKMSY